MELYIIPVDKSILDSIPEAERELYIHIGHLRNEIVILEKLLMGAKNNVEACQSTGNDQATLSLNVSQSLVLAKILAGKLVEGWELIQKIYFGSKVSVELHGLLSDNSAAALKNLKKYFNGNNLLRTVRNQFAFHYSPENIRSQMADTEDSDDLRIYVAEHAVNTLYHFSDVIANSAMLKAIGGEDFTVALRRLLEETIGVAESFAEFCDGCLQVMVNRYLLATINEKQQESIEILDLPKANEIRIPSFIGK